MQKRDSDDSLPENLDTDDAFGEWLHGRLKKRYGFETLTTRGPRRRRTGQTPGHGERARRVAQQIQSGFPPALHRQVEVIRMKQVNAFIAPGRYLYITSSLMAQLPTDDSISLVIGHEIAHAELGHLFDFRKRAIWKEAPAGDIVFILTYLAQRFVSSPENERDADAYGLDLALRAGYDGDRCLKAFAVLERSMIKAGAEKYVTGPAADRPPSDDSFAVWKARAEVWLWERRTGYPALRDRRAALADRLAQHKTRGEAPLLLPGSLTSTTSATAGFLARRQAIDEELAAWGGDLTALAADHADTMRRPVALRLEAAVAGTAAGLDGRTARAVETALADLKSMESRIASLFALHERALEIRRFLSYDTPAPSALAELLALLFGKTGLSPSEAPSDSGSRPNSKEPAGGGSSHSPRRIVTQLAGDLRRAQDTLDSVEAIWERWQPFLADCAADLKALEEARSALSATQIPERDDLPARFAALKRRVESDPIDAGPFPDRGLRAGIDRACEQMRGQIVKRREMASRLSRADALLERIRARHPNDSAPDRFRLLSDELAGLHACAASGRLETAHEGLTSWLGAALEHISEFPESLAAEGDPGIGAVVPQRHVQSS